MFHLLAGVSLLLSVAAIIDRAGRSQRVDRFTAEWWHPSANVLFDKHLTLISTGSTIGVAWSQVAALSNRVGWPKHHLVAESAVAGSAARAGFDYQWETLVGSRVAPATLWVTRRQVEVPTWFVAGLFASPAVMMVLNRRRGSHGLRMMNR